MTATARNGAAPLRRLAQAACVLLALVGLAPTAAQAQVEDYISNLRSQTFATNQNLVESSRRLSQPFETGSESGGYPLQEVVLRLGNFGPRTIQVTIRENDANDLPGRILYTLTNPASLVEGENTFTAPAGATLAADTRYHIVAEREGIEKGDVALWHGLNYRQRPVIDNAGGWGINFDYLEKVAGGTPWEPARRNYALAAAVRGERPQVTVTSDGDVTEGSAAVFTLTRTGDLTGELVVAYEVTATGDFGVTTTGAGTATFLADNSTVQVSVATTGDTTHEAHGSVTLTLQAGTGYAVGTPDTATAAVEDDDNAAPTGGPPTIDDTTPLVGEVLTASTSGIDDPDGLTNRTFTYQWIRTSGSTDTRISGATAATYAVVAADRDATLKVEVKFTDDDGTTETLTSAATATVGSSIVWVTSDGDVTEGNPAVWTLRRTGSATGMLRVAFNIEPSGGDFGLTAADGTTFPVGSTTEDETTFPAGSSTMQVSLSTVDDSTHEADGTVFLSVLDDHFSDGSYSTGDEDDGQPEFAVLKIRDDDNAAPTGAPTIDNPTPMAGQTLTADASGINDPDGLTVTDATFTWQWIRVPSGGTDTPIAGATAATYTVGAADVGATLKVAATFTDDDGTEETVESAATSAVAAAAVTLPTVTVARVSTPVEEGEDAQFTVTRTVVTTGALTVAYRVSETGDMVAAGDEDAQTVDFADGDTQQTVTVPTVEDSVHEADSTVTVTLTADTGGEPTYLLGAPTTAEVTVEDDDNAAPTGAPTIDDTTPVVGETLMADASGIDDPDGLTSSTDFTWQWLRVASGGGTPAEITGATTASYTVADADVGATLKVRVGFTDDDGTGEMVESAETATVTPYTITAASPTVTEGDDGDAGLTTLQFALTRSDTGRRVELGWRVATEGTAQAATDFAGQTQGTLVFSPNISGRTVTFVVTRDTVDESDETVVLELFSVAGTPEGVTFPATVTGTIVDDDTATLSIGPSSVSVDEGDSGTTDLVFTVSMDLQSDREVTVEYDVGGTAESGADYEAPTPARVTFPALSLEAQTITFRVIGDTDAERDETVEVELRDPSGGAVLGTARAEGTIRNDDEPVLSVVPSEVDEGDSGLARLTFRVTMSGQSDTDVTVDYRVDTDAGTATAGTDYRNTPGTATIRSGFNAAVVNVRVEGDTEFELDETVVMVFENPVGAVLDPDPTRVTGTIRNDDLPPVTVAAVAATVTEGEAAAFRLRRPDVDTSEALVVSFTVADPAGVLSGTAPVTATIAAGETEETVSLDTVDDGVHETHGSVTLTLAAGAGYVLGPEAERSAEVTVRDNDDSPATGVVTVTGTATEGETLTADTSGITDGDGLVNAAYVYQWVRTPSGSGDTDISGATGATYVPVFADAGATLKVEVTVTDDEGHEAAFTSAATSAVAALPRPEVTVASDGDVTEGDTVTFTLTRTVDTTGTLDVAYAVTASGDFGAAPGAGTATFLANSATVQVSVDTTDDGAHEAHGSVTVTLTADTGADPAYLLGDPAVATAAVEDDDDSPATGSVTVTGTATEGETLTADTSGLTDADGLDNAAYTYQWVRTPAGGSDTDISGATSQTYVPVFADAGATLKVRVTVTDDEGHQATITSTPTSAVAALPRVSVMHGGSPVTEGGVATFTFTLSKTIGDIPLRVNIRRTETGNMMFPNNLGRSVVVFGPNQTTLTVSYPTVDDDTTEPNSTVTVEVLERNYYIPGTPSMASVEVRDDDDSPATGSVTVTGTATEGQTLTADTSGLTDEDGLDNASYVYQWVRTPAGGSDADISGATSQTYVPVYADAGATLKVRVTVTDDEGHEATFTSAATSAVAALPRPSVTVASDGDVTEGSAAVFTLTRTGDLAQTLDVDYEVTATGDFGVTTGAGTASFPANSATVQVDVPTTGDATHEAHGSVTVTLTADTGDDPAYLPGDPATATATVRDDDAPPTVTLVLTPDTITEAGGVRVSTVTATLDHPSSEETTVTVSATPVSPAVAGDYTLSSNLELTIPAGATDSMGEVTITAMDNSVYEGDKTVTVSATATNTLGITAPQDVTLTITDDEPAPTLPALSIADARVNEGDTGSTTLDFTVTLDRAATATVTVEWATSDGTATAGTDYTAGNGTVTFSSGDSSKTVSVTVAGDNVDEPRETFTVTLTNPSGATLGDDTATGTIIDNDARPTVTLVLTPASISEDGGVSMVTARLSHPSSEDTTLTVETAPVSPAVAGDYTLTLVPLLSIPAGETESESTNQVRLTAVDNSVYEGDKTVTVSARVQNRQGVTAPQSVTLTITDDESAPPVLSIGDASVDEGDTGSTTLDFTVTLDRAATETVTVEWATSDGTATAGTDYTAGTGTLTFSSGDSSKTVSVTVAGDEVDEPNETFEVTLSNPSGATLGDDTATGTITDDDDAPTVTLVLTPDTITESGGASTVTASLDHPSSESTTVTVTATPESPAVAGDYTLSGSELTIAAGATTSTGTVTITAVDNAVDAPHKTVTVSATATNAQGITAPQDVTLTILDDENVVPTGKPTIDDETPVVGETLTADTSDIGDSDGLAGVAYAYRWLRVAAGGAVTEVGTGQSYTVVDADVGSTLKVAVTFTDEGGAEETVESEATAAAEALPEVTVASDGAVTEGSPAVFTLTRTGSTAEALDVVYEVTATGDFGAATGAGTATFLANNATVQVSVATTDDSTHETNGSVTLTLTADTGADPAYLLGDPSTATAAVEDDDDSPATGVVTVMTATTFTEGETLTADTSGLTDEDGLDNAGYTYQWVRTPSGGSDTDISGATSQTYVPVFADAGATLKVRVTVTDDEGHEATFESDPTSTIAALRSSVTVVSDGDVTEGDTVMFALTRTGATAQTLDVAYEVTATGNFGAATGAGTATFLANNDTVQVSVATTGDGAHEAHGSVTLTLTADTSANPAYLLGDPSTATAVVRDDDNAEPTGVPTIDDTTPEVGQTLTASTSGIDDPDGLATPGFTWQWIRVPSGGGTETRISGATAASYTVVAADEGETLKVEVGFTDDDGTTETLTSAATMAVEAAAPTVPEVSIVPGVGGSLITEGGEVTFTLTISEPPAVPLLLVNLRITETGDMMTANNLQFPIVAAFPRGAETSTLSYTTIADDTDEPNSTVTAEIVEREGSNYVPGTPSMASVEVRDDDRPDGNAAPTGRPTIDDTTPAVGETLTAAPSDLDDPDGLTSPTYAWRWIRVASGGVETVVGTGMTYVVVAADAGARLKVEATFTDDAGVQETVESEATSAVEVVLLPTVSVARVSTPVAEGAGAQFTVTRTVVTAGALTVNYGVSETGDMVASGEEGAKTVAFADGETRQTVMVPTEEDDVHEADSTVTVTLTADAAYALGTDDTAEVTVEDDDNAAPTDKPTIDDTTPVVGQTLTADPSGIGDPDGLTNRIFTWQWIRVSGGTDTPIAGATMASYTVVAGDVGATLKVEASFTDDDETDEAVESAETATVEAAPVLPVLSIGDASVDEGDTGSTTLDFTVTLDRAATATVTVEWATSDGTATAGTDYTAGNGTVTFSSGDSSKTVSVTVTGDNVDEPNETFTVTLTNPSGATLGDDTATGTITDDDGPPTVTLVLTPDTITEDGGVSTVTATLDHPSSEATTVTVTATPQSPAVEGDYTLSGSRLTIPAGATDSTGEVTITAMDNAVDAPHKTVTVSATATNAQGITAPQDVTLTILDDENVAATGAPTIDDETPVVGETLTADTSGIGDSDGLAGAAYAYRWLRVAAGGAVTEVGTGQSYTVVAADVGSTLKVAVTFTDEGGAEETIESAATAAAEAAPTTPTTIFDADGNYSLITQYGRTTTVDLTAYLAEGVASSAVSFEVDDQTDCGATRADYYQSVTVSGSTLSLVPNNLGHTHGSSTESETACVVTGTMGGQSEARTFSFQIPAPRWLTQVPVMSVVDRQEDALGVQVRDPSGLGSSWLRLSWRETEKNNWEHRIMSGARLRRAEPPVIRIEGLESGTSYTVQAAVLRREAFDYYANGRTIAERVLTTLEGQGSKWLANMRGGGQSAVARAEAATTMGEPVFLRASVNGDVLTVTMNEALAGAQVPAASAFTVSGGHTVSGVAVSGSSLTLTLMPFVGADETVTVSYAVPGSGGSKLQDDEGNAAPAFTDEAVANETPTVKLVLTPDTIGEDGETSTVTATLDKPSPQATTVTVTPPSSGAGYSLGANRELTIAANALTSTGVVRITAEDNDVDAPNKTVAVSAGAENSQGVSGPDDVTLTITDDDDAPTVTLVLTPASISEDGGVSMVTARLDHPSSEDTTLTVETAPVSPAVAGDYTLTAVPLLSIPAGETESESASQVRITAVDNDVIASDKTVTVSARVQNRQGVTAPQSVTLTITDDESAPPVLSIGDASVDEGDTGSTTLDFTVTLDRAATETVTVEWATSDGTATAGTDYTAGNGSLTFSSGDSSKTVSVTVAGDNVDEPNETFEVTLSNPSGATLGDDTATGTITDDDAPPTVTLVLTPASIAEAAGQSTVTATLNHPSSEETTVTVTAAPESPAVASDYTLSGSELTIPAGATDSTGTVTITAVDNAVHAPHKTVTVSATATNAQGITTPQDVTLTILDDDNAAPTGELTIDDTTPVVGQTLTADASGIDDPDGLTDEIDLQWLRVPSGGTATEITGATSETYTVVADDVGATLKVEASFTDDGGTEETVESEETATVEAAPTLPALSIADARVNEGDTGSKTLDFTVTLDRAATATVTVEWATSDGTATAGTDYTAGNGTVTFSSGDSSKTVSVTVAGDNVDEPRETFTVTLTNPSGATLGDDTATGTIIDNDARPTVTLVLTPASISEDGGVSMVTARLSHPSSEDTTLTVETAPVSPAVAGDYTLTLVPLLLIPAGETESESLNQVRLTAVDNSVYEGDKTVTVSARVQNRQGVTAPQNVTLTITDDEPAPPALSIGDASVDEGDTGSTTLDFTVTLDRAATETVTVEWATSDGTATAGTDYTAGTGSLTFSSGDSSKTVSVTVAGDEVDEPNETFEVTLSNPSGATLGDDTATGTITDDDDAPTVTLVLTPDTITESGEASTVTASLDHPSSESTTVTVTATPESPAVAGDYTLSGSELTIAAGATTSTGTVTITAVDNAVHAPDKRVTVSATATNAQGITTPQDVTLTILDDDNAAPTGAPTIDDTTPVVGQTLTADASGIDDPDGLTDEIDLQWLRVASGGGETEVGTGASYTVVTADRGSTLKVKATFTDDDNTEETIESEETAAVERPPVVTPSSDGDVTEGDPAVFTLTRTGSTAGMLRVKFDIEPSGGDFGLTLTADGTTTTFPVGSRTEVEATFPVGSSTMKVSLSTVDDNTHEADGTVFLTVLLSDDEVYALGDIDFATLKIRDNDNAPPTGTVTIDDTTPVVGETLTADASDISDADGPASPTFTWQWIRVSSGTDTRIPGATSADYTVVAADLGAKLKVEASFRDDGGTDEAVESAETAAVGKALPTVTVTPVTSPVVESEDAQFTVTRTGVTTGALTVRYNVIETGAMVRSGDKGAKTVDFSGDTASVTVTVPTVSDNLHEGNSRVTVTLTADAAYALGTDATARVLVKDDDDSPATGTVTVTGTAREGETLTANTSDIADEDGGLDTAAYVYQWVRTPAGGSDEDISGATSRTYVPVFADAGATLKVKVTVTDGEGHEATFTSAATSAVAALPEVTVASDGDVTEGSAAAFTLTRTGGSSAPWLIVNIQRSVSGDFGVVKFKTTSFPAGATTTRTRLHVADDEADEAHGAVTLTVLPGNGYRVGTPSAATAKIFDATNVAPTGAVTIDDTSPVVGEMLTADPSGIADADGLTSRSFTWQWVRVSGGTETPIDGATAVTYTVVAADVGATLKVKATFTDDGGIEETVESAATATVEAALLPTVTVTVTPRKSPVSEGDLAAEFTVTRTGDTTEALRVRVSVSETGDMVSAGNEGGQTRTIPAGQSSAVISVPTVDDGVHEADSVVTLTLEANAAYELGTERSAEVTVEDDDDSPATGSVTVMTATTFTEGETLSADTSGLADGDGLADATYAYQWVRTPTGGSDADISGATSKTYVPVFADAGATLKVRVTVIDDEGHEATFTSAATSAVAATPRPSVTVVSDGDVTEGSAAVFTLTRTGDTAETLDVAYAVAAAGDFGAATGAGTATFLANNATVQVSVDTTGDDAHEAHGSVTVTLTADTGADPAYLLGDPLTATAAVRDDDDSPATGTVTVTTATTFTEGETLTADTSGLTDGDGLATAAYAYQWVRTPSGGSDTDLSGATSQTYVPVFADAGATLKVKVTVTDDEGHEATFTSAPTSAVAAAARPSVTVVSDGDVTEGSPAVFTLTRTGDTAGTLDVAYAVTATGDFGVTTGAVTATFLANSATVQVSVDTTGDGAHEAHGTVTVTLTADTGADPAYLLGAPATATAAVRDDDNASPTGAVTIDDTTPVVGETLNADASSLDDPDGLTSRSFTWQWLRVSGGTETEITGATAVTYTVVAADVGAKLKVKATFTDDGGTDETVESAQTSAAKPPSPVLTVAAGTSRVTEGTAATFTVTRTVITAGALTAHYQVSETGDAVAASDEGAKSVDFADGETGKTVTVPTAGDGGHEADSVVTVTLTADAAYELGAQRSAEVTVEDDDNAAPTGAVTIDDPTPVVGQTLTADTSNLDDPDGLTSRSFTWQWLRVSGGTETVIAGASTASYPVAAADVGAMLKVRVGFTDDDGTGETVESAPTGAVGTYTITAASPRVTEGDDGSALLDFALTRSETGQRVELGWRVTTEGTAQPVRPVTDFAGPMEGTLVFSPNTRSRSVYLQVVPDIVDESDETVVLELFSVAGTPEGVTFPARVTGTIVDDDTATLSIAPWSVDEGDAGTRELAFTVSLDLESDREVTVEYDVGGTAESGADYEAPTPVLVTFPALFWEPQRIVFRVLGDTDAERHETVTVELRNPTGGAALGTSQATATIRNDDGLVVSVDPPEVAEGDSRADGARLTFRLELSGQADTDVTVDYRVDAGAGTATPGADFKDKSGTATIKSGRTFAVVKLGILEDTAIEPDETVVMVFENPRGAVLYPDSARVTGTILDDDLSLVNDDLPLVTVAAESGPVTEGEDAVFVLRRAGDASAPLTVTVDVSEAGSVLAGPAPTEVTFGADEAQTRLRVATEDDATAEADGRVTATVIAGTGYTVAAGAGSAGVDVLDNDAPAAPEETVTLWSTTMTVADLGGSVGASGPDLADPDWSEDGVEYALELLRWFGPLPSLVEVRFNRRPPRAEELTLHAGGLTLALAEGGSGQIFAWSSVEGEPWAVGEEVELRLTRTVADEDHDGAAGPGISVADARVHESAGTPLAFRVTLDEARTSAVSVRYATSDGSATAGADYVAASGVVRFEAGETEKTVHVAVLEDAHDEGEETMTLTLSSPFGAEVSDGVATGTIVNTDAMPRAWLGRFGRTVAGQVVDAVEARMTAVRRAGVEVSIAGRRVGAAGAFDESATRGGDAAGGRPAGGLAGESGSEGLDMVVSRDAALAGGRLAEWFGVGVDAEERTVSGRALLAGTSFARTEGTAESGFVSVWGRGVVTDFDGRDGELSVDGEVATGLLGADWARADWAAGLMVGHSRGKGSYRGEGAGTVSSSLTGLYPWGRRALNDRVMVWGVVGYGEGTLTLEPEGQARIETDMDLAMAAAGLRGVLVEAPAEGGIELAAKTDGLIVRSTSDSAGSDGGLEAARAKVTRLRLGLEGTRAFRSEGGGTVTPSFGLGVRHDGGDAETGFGVEVGAGVVYADPSSGVTADLQGRGLLGHEASGFREFGLSGSLAFDPSPSSDRGLSLSLSQTVGASAPGGVEALYGRDTMAGLGGADDGAGSVDSAGRRRLEARVGYGVSAFGGRFTGTPELGIGLSESGRDYRLGWRLTPAGGNAGSFEFGVEATRREAANGDGSEHGVGVRATIRW